MNPYSDLSFPRPSDITDSAHVQMDQSQQPPPASQWELSNPYADLVLGAVPAPNPPALVQSESVSANGDVERSRSADATDQSDASNPRGLSIVSAQFEAEIMDPDLDCSICFSQFNNAFRCPKKLQCGHTFCLECLARMNVKSPEPSAVQCPLCRALTPLPDLGLPQLGTDPNVLSHLPSSMQRIYSVRFLRNKGRLQLKRPDIAVLTDSARRSVDVGRPSPAYRPMDPGELRPEGAFFRFGESFSCRTTLITSVVVTIICLIVTIVFLLTDKNRAQ